MRKLMIFTAGFVAAVAALIYLFQGTCFAAIPAAACVTVLLFLLPGRLVRGSAIFFLGLTLGALWCSFYTAVILRPADDLCGTSTPFTARASEHSSAVSYGSRVTADILLEGRDVRAILYYPEDIAIQPGDLLMGTAVFQRTAMSIAEGEDLYDISRGIYLIGETEGVLTAQKEASPSLGQWLLRFSERLKENLYSVFPADSAGFFTALTTGDRSGMAYSFRNRLAVVGLYHAVSLSGMHISILMGTVSFFCMGRKKLAAAFGIPAIILFCLLSGGNPATVRAVCMHIILLAGLFLNREYDPLTALSAAMLFLLLENPWSISHWGLQLSFASTAGILLLMPGFTRRMTKNRLARAVLTPMCVTISATVFSAPLMSFYFGMNSLAAPVTNLLALWSVTLSFVGGIMLSFLAFLSPAVTQYLAQAADLLYRWLKLVTDIFSGVSFAAVYAQTPLLLAWSYLFYVLLTASLLRPIRWQLTASAAAAAALILALMMTPDIPDGVTVLDVGQGQSILIRSGDDTVLVDCGASGDTTGEDAARFLLAHGITELDAVVLTHFDADHCNGVPQLLDRVSADAVYIPYREEPSDYQQKVLSAAGSTEVFPVVMTTALSLYQGEMILYPAVDGKNENDTGLSVLASVRECDILITGDLDTMAEARLMACYDLPDLEVLVAGHHGSKSSTGRAILDALRPETVLISVGENRHQFPAPETIVRILETGAKIYSTKENGNLTIRW